MKSWRKQFEGASSKIRRGFSLGRVEQRKRDVAVFGGIEDGGSMMRRLSVPLGTGQGVCLSA
jgi:hypothetical protein